MSCIFLSPVLFGYLASTCQSLASGQKVPRSIDRVFYALETFCETMESKMEPYVPALMEHFFAALNPSYPFHVKELALSAIGATGIIHGVLFFINFCIVSLIPHVFRCSKCSWQNLGSLLQSGNLPVAHYKFV